MPCNRENVTGLKKNALCCLCLDKVLELVDSEIELVKTVSQPLLHPAAHTGEAPQSPLRWVLSQQALLELATALHGCGAFADEKGGKVGFTALMRVLCGAFNIQVNDIYVKRTQMFDRCTDCTPFLDKLIETFNSLVNQRLK